MTFTPQSNFALVVHSDRRVLSRDGGVLTTVRKDVEGIVFTTFESAVERLIDNALSEPGNVFTGTAQWVEDATWCIG